MDEYSQIRVADELLERGVAQPAGPGQRRVVGRDVRERVELELRLRARVGDVLDVEAELVGVVGPQEREVLDHLKHVLREREPGVGAAGDRAAEVRDARHGDRRSDAGVQPGHAPLTARGVLHAQLVQEVRAHRRHELRRGRVLPVAEVGPPLHGVQPAADVVDDEVVEIDVPGRQAVGRVDRRVHLPDAELGVERGRHVGWLGEPERGGVRRRDRDDAPAGQVAVRVLEAREVLHPVADDRPAQIDGEQIDVGRRLVGVCRREERRRGEGLPLEAIARLPFHRVRARRRDRVVDHPHRLTELRRVAGGDDLDFADHDLRHRHLAEAGAVLLGVVVAVDLVVHAKQGAVRRQPRHAELLGLEAGHAGLQQREVVRVARGERQRLDLALVDRTPLIDAAGIDDRRVGDHRDGFGDRADAEPEVDDSRLAGGEHDASLLELLESGELSGDTVGAEREQRRAVDAGVVREDAARRAGVEIRHGDRHARQHRAGVVRNRAFDGAVDRLGLGERGGRAQQRDDEPEPHLGHHFLPETSLETEYIAAFGSGRNSHQPCPPATYNA